MSEEERQAIIHLLDKQARYEYCINNNISFSDEDYEAYIIRQSMINKDKEIKRLNNIINELEKYLLKLMKTWNDCTASDIYMRLKELKGEDKKIKEIDMFDYFTGYDYGGTNKKLLKDLEHNFETLNSKINEIIDKMNKE